MKKQNFFSALAVCLTAIPTAATENKKLYPSQFGQDKYMNEQFFKNKRNGVFVDIGAFDGIIGSNTSFFENELGWTGICIEPIPEIFEKLQKNRSCICIKGCIADSDGPGTFLQICGIEVLSGLLAHYDPRHMARAERELRAHWRNGTLEKTQDKKIIEVDCYTLETILTTYNIYHIDYLSIDTEGNELSILKSIDFEKFDIDIIDVENNYKNPEFKKFLEGKGYKFVKKMGVDEIYQKIKK